MNAVLRFLVSCNEVLSKAGWQNLIDVQVDYFLIGEVKSTVEAVG